MATGLRYEVDGVRHEVEGADTVEIGTKFGKVSAIQPMGRNVGHTMEELEEAFFDPEFDRDKFFQGAREVLEAIAAFWDGLEEDRKNGVVD